MLNRNAFIGPDVQGRFRGRLLCLIGMMLLLNLVASVSWAREFQYGEVMGEYKGVEAHCNGAPEGNDTNDTIEYSCVSYVRLFYQTIYHIELGSVGGSAMNAFRMWGSRDGFEACPQGGTTPPRPDDILCFGGGTNGHVAIVTSVGNDSLEVIEQNVSLTNCRRILKMSSRDGYRVASSDKLPVQGWLHYKKAIAIASDSAGYNDWAPQPIGGHEPGLSYLTGPGERVLFLSDRAGKTVIYVGDVQTGKVRRIADLGGMQARFVFDSLDSILLIDDSGLLHLMVLDSKTLEYQRLVGLGVQAHRDSLPYWDTIGTFYYVQPDGKIMHIFLASQYDARKILVYTPQEIPMGFDAFVMTRPDAKGHTQLALMDKDGKLTNWLTGGRFDNMEPSNSVPSGIRILGQDAPLVYASNKYGQYDIFQMVRVNGVPKHRRLTADSANERQPAQAFNGDAIYYVKEVQGHKRLWRMNSDGSHQEPLPLR